MTGIITGAVWVTKSIHVAAELGIADLVAGGPKTATELAALTNTHADSLYRVLRALASVGVFAEDGEGRFALTPLAETLRSDVPASMRPMALLWGEPRHWFYWGSFLDTVRTGTDAWQLTTGGTLFEYFAKTPDIAAMFDGAMTSFSVMEAEPVAHAYDFTGARTIVDVGGGHGYLLRTILDANPALRGMIFDLPHVADRARLTIEESGHADRIEVVPGNFFESVPSGGDVYILKNIVHDFDDDRAAVILRNIRAAVGPAGKLLIVQEAIPAGNGPSAGKLLDMQMLLIGGRERTEEEFHALLARTGFRLARVIPTASPLHIIEAESV
jgi:hypothetical protein